MSGIVGSKFNIRGSGLVGSLGTDGQHMLSAGPGVSNVFETVAAGGGKFESKLLHVIDEKADNNAGGASTTGSYLTRDLNTVVTNEITGASLASDQISLPAGTYYIQAAVPAYESIAILAKLYNITDSADELIGHGTGVAGNLGVGGWSFVIGRFTIADTKVFEIQMRFGRAKANNGMGLEMAYGVVEHYTLVQIWQI